MSDITRSEAIEALKQLRLDYVEFWEELNDETTRALDMAIASLEADEAYQLEYERTTKEIPIKLNITEVKKHQSDFSDLSERKAEDCISREFQEIVVEYPPEDLCTYPEYKGKPYFSIKYKEGNDYFIGYGTYKPEVFSRYLRDYFMPPVTPQEPRKGHWIEHEWEEMREKGYYRCSVCNHGYQRYTKGIRKSDVPYIDGQEYKLWNCDNYCPNCGAKMVESQESEDKE